MVGNNVVYIKWHGICRGGLDSSDSVVDSCKSFPVSLQKGRQSKLNICGAALFSSNISIYRSHCYANTTRGCSGANVRIACWQIVCVCVCVRARALSWAIVISVSDTLYEQEHSTCIWMKSASLLEHEIPDQWTTCVLKNLKVHARNIIPLWSWWLTNNEAVGNKLKTQTKKMSPLRRT
jgi:hypothetical protein